MLQFTVLHASEAQTGEMSSDQTLAHPGLEQLKTLARKAVDVDRRTPLLRLAAFVAVLTLPSWLINIWICLLVLRISDALLRFATQKAWGWIFSRDYLLKHSNKIEHLFCNNQ